MFTLLIILTQTPLGKSRIDTKAPSEALAGLELLIIEPLMVERIRPTKLMVNGSRTDSVQLESGFGLILVIR